MDDEEHDPLWQEYAEQIVDHALELAEIDDVRGSVTIFSRDDRRYDQEFDDLSSLIDHLEELYNQQWYANVPFEGGAAVFDGEPYTYVSEAVTLHDSQFEKFFEQIKEPEDTEEVMSSRDLVITPAQSKIIRADLSLVTGELISHLQKHPEKAREMDPESFERLLEAIFKNQGYDVERTRYSKDGGFDLAIYSKDPVGAFMTLVDCKRYAEKKKVGVEVVRGLYGIVTDRKASNGLIVTTSTFTKGAVEFRERNQYRLALADFERFKSLLNDYKF